MVGRRCLHALALSLGALAQEELDLTQPYVAPKVDGLHFAETFDGDVWSRWAKSAAEKYNGAFNVSTRTQEALRGDLGFLVPEESKHYGAAVKFAPLSVQENGGFAVQFEVKFQAGLSCGGSYLKIFNTGGSEPSAFQDDTRYVVMFGPDRCGATNKIHFILQHKSPATGNWEEKHFKDAPAAPSDELSHLYGLFIRPDNSFEIQVDLQTKASGSLLESMSPAINPAKVIDDPSDSKPGDWIDEAKMDDPKSSKPDDWNEDEPFQIPDPSASLPSGWKEDEELKIPDPNAVRPGDWDDDEDGEWEAPIISNPACKVGCGKWEAPKIKNPAYKGKWYAPKIDNPAYKGEWKPRQIDNPDYFVDNTPYRLPEVNAIGIDIWTISKGLIFDNIVLDTDADKVQKFGSETFKLRSDIEQKQVKAKTRKNTGFFGQALDTVVDNLAAFMLTALALFGGLIWLCIRSSSPPPPPRAPSASQSSGSDASAGSKDAAGAQGEDAKPEGEDAKERQGGLSETLHEE
eukprot:TRINITY_DN16354_c0_g1_i1.p1 TRINITY_DN16354_c0_g1~~TRINITY_DN16354_c0_g1_i1.p1  ORF type:complete len:529 (-),score=125.15 TRINITY_DN16354_c0_g1_i1:115-1665(-)